MKRTKLFSIIFMIAGIGMLIGFYFMVTGKTEFIKNSIVGEGTVTEIIRKTSTDSDGDRSYSYYPVIEYTTENGDTYSFTSKSGSYPSSYSEGDKVEIRYDPGSPGKAEINRFASLWMGPLIVGLFGVIFFVLGISMLRNRIKKDRRKKNLLRWGKAIEAKVTGVEKNTGVSVNGKHPYRIVSQYSRNNELYVFESDNIWFDPTDFIQKETIKIYVDPGDMKKYYVDISFLPNKK